MNEKKTKQKNKTLTVPKELKRKVLSEGRRVQFYWQMDPETLFLMLLKFGAVLSIICGFLMAIYTWTHLVQCTVVVRSFLRMLKLRKLAVRKLVVHNSMVKQQTLTTTKLQTRRE